MRKSGFVLLLFIAGVSVQNTFGQSTTRQVDTAARYYARLAKSTNETDHEELKAQLYQLLKSKKEEDWLTARRFFYELKKVKTSDSIANAVKIKFPLGQLVRNDAVDTIYNQKDPAVKEKLFRAWIRKFPPKNFGSDAQIIYDYARYSVAVAYAEADNVKKAVEWANAIAVPAWKGNGWSGVANILIRKGHLEEAEELLEKTREDAYQYTTTRKNEPGAGFAAIGLRGATNSLTEIYIKRKKYAEALKYIKEAYDTSATVSATTSDRYAKVLIGLGRDGEAFQVIDKALRAGQGTKGMKDALKTLYPKVKGSNEGYDEYIASVNKLLAEKIREELQKQMINTPAPEFTLKDVDGNEVSLASLKGKVIVLDFWATWCGPCKASFPAMKQAMERLKENPDVKFLYVHTLERDSHTATQEAKQYVMENKYPFEVLMDLKDAEGINRVVDSYKVKGIPTKFIIDRQGNIRFRVTGFSGGEDAAVEEVVSMVEMAAKG